MKIVRSGLTWSLCDRRGLAARCLRWLAREHGYRVGEMCRALNCSERSLRAAFVRDVGMAPKEWMRQQRMVVARQWLAGGRRPSEVADGLGFATAHGFRREFRATYEVSPARFRQLEWRRRAGAGG